MFIYIKVKEPNEAKREIVGANLLILPKDIDGNVNITKLGKYIGVIEPSIRHRTVKKGEERLKGYNSGIGEIVLNCKYATKEFEENFKRAVEETEVERLVYVAYNKKGRGLERELGNIVKVLKEKDKVSNKLSEVVIVVENKGTKEEDIDRMIKLLGIKFWKVVKESSDNGK